MTKIDLQVVATSPTNICILNVNEGRANMIADIADMDYMYGHTMYCRVMNTGGLEKGSTTLPQSVVSALTARMNTQIVPLINNSINKSAGQTCEGFFQTRDLEDFPEFNGKTIYTVEVELTGCLEAANHDSL